MAAASACPLAIPVALPPTTIAENSLPPTLIPLIPPPNCSRRQHLHWDVSVVRRYPIVPSDARRNRKAQAARPSPISCQIRQRDLQKDPKRSSFWRCAYHYF